MKKLEKEKVEAFYNGFYKKQISLNFSEIQKKAAEIYLFPCPKKNAQFSVYESLLFKNQQQNLNQKKDTSFSTGVLMAMTAFLRVTWANLAAVHLVGMDFETI